MSLMPLLAENREFDAEYGDGLSNHLSMALIALARLGATDERVQEYFDFYRLRLDPLRAPVMAVTRANWREGLGTHRHYCAYLKFFIECAERGGWRAMMQEFLPALLPGLGAGAFHPLIRLAYGIEAEDSHEVAAGVAYLASRYLPLGEPGGETPASDDPAELLERLAHQPGFNHPWPQRGLITERMRDVADCAAFRGVIDRLTVNPHNLQRLARCAIQRYAQTRDFTALHLVTGTHALRVALPHVLELAEAVRQFWQAFAAAYLSIGLPVAAIDAPDDAAESGQGAGWEEIARLAVGSSNDHVIKLVYSCREEDRVYADPLYRAVAQREVGIGA